MSQASDEKARLVSWASRGVAALVLGGLIGLQAFVSATSRSHICYEELAEAVRNVFWLDERTIYDGVSSNVGWYGLLLVVYKVFGFQLYFAKCVRLALSVAGLLSAWALLRRPLGRFGWIVPLLALGLSPTVIHFTTLETSMGTDLAAWLVIAWLVQSFEPSGKPTSYLRLGLIFVLSMVASMMYPTFLFYLPALGLWTLWKLRPAPWRARGIYVALAGAAFLLPMALPFLYLRDPKLLLFDPASGGKGIFRGGGQLAFEPARALENLAATLRDLFQAGHTYYFNNIRQPEFSGTLGLVCVAVLVTGSFAAFAMDRSLRLALGLAWVLILTNLIFGSISGGPPGLRRASGVVAGLLLVFAALWAFGLRQSERNGKAWGLLAALALLPLHHALVFSRNLRALDEPGCLEESWFRTRATPDASLAYWVEQTETSPASLPSSDRYAEIYAALNGYRRWNHLPERELRAPRPGDHRLVTLSVGLWERYELPH
jgi:hypothetical protein